MITGNRLPLLIATILIGLLGLQLLGSYDAGSPTVDEPNHFVRGYAIWKHGDTRLSIAHPPLGNLIGAAASADAPVDYEFGDRKVWRDANLTLIVRQFIRLDYESIRAGIMQSRLMIASLSLLLAIYLFWRVGGMFGQWPAVFTVGLYVVSPTLLAHAKLMTTDFAITFFTTIFLLEWIAYLKSGRFLKLFIGATLLALVCVTKFSGPLFVGFAFLSFLYCVITRQGLSAGKSLRWNGLTFTLQFVLIGVVSLVVINSAYLFQKTGLTNDEIFALKEPVNEVTEPYNGKMMEELWPVRILGDQMPILLPYTYLYGITSIRAHNQQGHSAYFMGERYDGGRLAYFPTLFLIKNSIIVPVALMLGLLLLLRSSRSFVSLGLPTQLTALFCLFVLGFGMSANINIGVRHVLPAFPAAIILAALVINHAKRGRSLALKLLFGVLGAEAVLAAALTYPNHLSFFNMLAGGAKYGHYISIVGEDWGQNAGDVARYFRDKGVSEPYNVFYGAADRQEFARNGVTPVPVWCVTDVPPNVYVAIGRTAEWRARDECFQWIQSSELIDVINNQITIYRTGNQDAANR